MDTIFSGSRSGTFYILLILFILFISYFRLDKIKIKYLIISPIIVLILFLNFGIATAFKTYKTYKAIDKPYFKKLHLTNNTVAPLTGIIFESDKDWFIRFLKRNYQWKLYSDHNQLRITRIIECLRLLISDEEADSFYSLILSMVGEETEINDITLDYWSKA